ncbi:MAG: hypothetical protein NC206_09290 [Bacteroides sp.]|nr:hypothetical protein [Roseburia sp.]MCM1347264.1 hypothetical protein [Bacteroides sp.]MCM1421688.1 hypothetical protein [Bacteroides sp.]
MAERNSKTIFTSDECQQLFSLVSELEKADSSKQKGIRKKIRKIGLYWSEVGIGDYTVANLELLFASKVLRLNDEAIQNQKDEVQSDVKRKKSQSKTSTNNVAQLGRAASDEYYVIDLCDEILEKKALRQYSFDFLFGDSGKRLPVDAYYPELDLVVEYHESQHNQAVPFFDKKQTVSGVSRGEQRRIYDERRQEVLPQHGIKLIIISYTDFGSAKKLNRNKSFDMDVVKKILIDNGIIK